MYEAFPRGAESALMTSRCRGVAYSREYYGPVAVRTKREKARDTQLHDALILTSVSSVDLLLTFTQQAAL